MHSNLNNHAIHFVSTQYPIHYYHSIKLQRTDIDTQSILRFLSDAALNWLLRPTIPERWRYSRRYRQPIFSTKLVKYLPNNTTYTQSR